MGQHYRQGPGRVCGRSARESSRPRVMSLDGNVCPGCHRRSRAVHRCTRCRLHPNRHRRLVFWETWEDR